MKLNNHSKGKIAKKIAEIETETSGEIFCVIARKSGDFYYLMLIYAFAVSILIPVILTIFGIGFGSLFHKIMGGWNELNSFQAEALFTILLQLVIFTSLAFLLKNKGLQSHLIPKLLKHNQVHKKAISQFASNGIFETDERTGVLIFLSLEEHMAEILADKGIYEKVSPEIWNQALSHIINEIKKGDFENALLMGVNEVGQVLKAHFPPRDNNANELPDSVVFI